MKNKFMGKDKSTRVCCLKIFTQESCQFNQPPSPKIDGQSEF